MTMNNIFTKLRKLNINNYIQLLFCVSFAVFLITSFAATLFSPTVQTVLPIGGDSRKQVQMIFTISLIGCLSFSIYAAGLFFKYKSKEIGVFLALGTPKSVLSKALYLEMIKMLIACIAVGLAFGSIASLGIWQLFRNFLVDTAQMKYQFSPIGLGVGLLFGLVVSLCILFMAIRFMKRSNLMDILNEQRKNEPITEVTTSYGVSGLIMLISGLSLGYAVPIIVYISFKKLMPSIWSAVYLVALVGVYRLITYAISHHERGKKPQKYYKNIIPFSMMKSQGKQTVRNMLVITLLIGASLFALFYVSMTSQSLFINADNPIDFSLFYKLSANEVNKDDIYNLAAKHNTEITKYNEVIFIEMIGSGVARDWSDGGDLIEDYQEKYKFSEFISESEFNRITGRNIVVADSTYYLITQPDTAESLWNKYDDLDQITNPISEDMMRVKFSGTIEVQELMSSKQNRYILSDFDFDTITKNISTNYQVKQILFNVVDVERSYPFAKDLYNEFVNRAPEEMGKTDTYDEYQEAKALAENQPYSYNKPIELTPENPDLMGYWKYYPTMKILIEKTFFQNYAIFYLLFIYVAIICLAAVGIISYTRSITIGINNKNLFDDLGKLGANKKYIKKCITSQLTKIFVIPAIIGSGLMLSFMFIIFYGNDRMLSKGDILCFLIDIAITFAVFLYVYIIYCFSLKKINKIVSI